ncbi:DUF11 domain-containing protein [Chitinophaga sp. SYP-B3965]|uniref:T9SS type B sorting domain-containing protein n=1 Tax=Chitinophaga sp. SYP-B3965 TaxID=2663120 RepID=UPI0012997165|nr:gliding motility-associated C-terminal domain-containing protein [Chitinophaga sp. SYP-B3965]MRG48903.1 DUF11 domain-containing protein [Chitinophaga sp. SYP-B3965]
MHVSLRVFVYSALMFCCALKVHAEGSKELTANGGSRAFWRSSTVVTDQFPFPYLGIIKVYANVGESIYMGSSAQGIGVGTITWRAPDGTTGTSGNSTTIGRIQDRNEETLGPRLTTNGVDPGYNPYIVTVGAGQAGVWVLTFNPTNPAVAGGTAPIVPANNPWTQNPNSWYIAAFDVSVRNAANTAFLSGRAFMNMFAAITSSVGATFGSFNGIFNILTRDGYQYTVNANGMQGVAFDFFVNNKGFRNASGDASYLSIAGIGTTAGTIPVHNPTLADDATNVTYKLFLSAPNTDLPVSAATADGPTWLLTTPIVPTLSNFVFTGTEGTPNQSGAAPLGGSFSFTSTAAGSYRISLDVNQNGIFTDVSDRLLTGFAVIGNNIVAWDALDGEGNPVPGGTTFLPGSIRIELFSGEVHFPLLDVERNPTGIIVTRINGLNAPDNVLFWDDHNIPDIGTPSVPKRNLDGQSSATNGHNWSLNFGNDNGMDSWSYISSAPLLNTVNLVVGQADLQVVRITPSAATFCDGATASYEVEVRNNGPSAVTNAPFNFRWPFNLTGVNVTFSVTTGTVTLSGVNNTPGVYHADLTMSNGGTIVFTITGTVSSGSIATSADIMRTADVTDPDATNPDIPIPVDALAECNAGPSGVGCNNIVSNTVVVGSAVTNNTVSAAQQICPGAVPAALTGSVPAGGTGTFTYLWESSTTNNIVGFAAAAGVNNGQGYAPAALSSTTWFRRVVNSGCSSTSVAVEITVTPPPAAPVVTPTQPTCAVATGTITVTPVAGLTYSINGVDYSAGPFVVTPGTYQVTARNVAGCTSPATQVIINAQPVTPAVPVATPTQPTCAVATGTITVTPVVGLTYSINGADYSASGTFTNVAAGTYQVTARNVDGCTSTATQVVINAQPVTPAAPVATPTQPTCAVATGTITVTPMAGLTYSINGTDYGASGTFTNVAAGTYQVTARNVDGCTSTATQVVINAQPVTPAAPVATPTQPTCAVATGTITVTPVAGLTYSINGTDYSAGPFIVTPGTYQVTARNADGCTSTATQVVINAQPLTPAAPVATPTQPTCAVSTGTITVTPVAGLTYSINGTDYSAGPFTVTPGTYQVTARNVDGCTSTATQVIINAQPVTPVVPVATPTQPTCAVATGTITVTSVAGITYSINGTDYSASGTFTNVAPGTYQVTARNTAGCTSPSTQVIINAQPAIPAAPGVANITYCQGDVAAALTATGTNIKWYNAGTGGPALPSPVTPLTTTAGVTTYWASQTNAGGCESPRVSLTVTVFAKPTLQVTSSTVDMLAADPRRELTGNVTGGTFTGTGVVAEAGRFYFNPATAGAGTHTITYAYTSGGNCTVNTTFTITVTAPVADVVVTVIADNKPAGIGDPFDYTITAGNNGPGTATNVVVTDVLPATVEVVSTNATAGTVTGTSTVTWNIPTLPPNTTNTLTITVKPTQLGVVQNTVTIASGQTDNTPANNTSVVSKEIVGLKIPNVITPNGDGYNDRFVIKGLELYPQNQLTIINRWGNHVYEKRNYANDWTGNGLAEGTYFYIIKLTDREGKQHDLKGYLMINR